MAYLSEEEIRSRAYQLWKQAGAPEGSKDTFWYKAEKELLVERGEWRQPSLDRTQLVH